MAHADEDQAILVETSISRFLLRRMMATRPAKQTLDLLLPSLTLATCLLLITLLFFTKTTLRPLSIMMSTTRQPHLLTETATLPGLCILSLWEQPL